MPSYYIDILKYADELLEDLKTSLERENWAKGPKVFKPNWPGKNLGFGENSWKGIWEVVDFGRFKELKEGRLKKFRNWEKFLLKILGLGYFNQT